MRVMSGVMKVEFSLKHIVVVGVMVLLQACATSKTVTHYGFFEAQNSVGEMRQFRVHWETTEVQSWVGERRSYTSPVILQAQCSERAIRLYDVNYRTQRTCMEPSQPGIAYCGNPRVDMDHRAMGIESSKVCAYITDAHDSSEIKDLDGNIRLVMRCQPRQTKFQDGRRWINRDSLMPSRIPYTVATKTIDGRERDGHVPRLWNHSSVCDPDQGR